MKSNNNKENKNTKLSVETAWLKILEKYNIIEEVEKNGLFYIKASQIKEFKEPRLMSKWDSSEQLPKPLKDNKINILPDSRSSYVIGDFLLYKEIPELLEHVNQMPFIELPEYETIDVDNITTESNAINVLILSRILDDFLGTQENVETFNGRMGTGQFDFFVDSVKKLKRHIYVNSAQCEIDGGFENDDSVVILEAKNVVHKDFHVRQLYYPYRVWKNKVKKPIRLVFSIYSNKIYRLFEYAFEDINDYSSIKLLQSKNYSLENTTITIIDILDTRKKTKVKYNDDMNDTSLAPFIQADNFDRVISLLENLYESPMSTYDVAELMQFQLRQSDYYFNAGKYLGLFEKIEEDKQVVISLTELGKQVYKLDYKNRQLKLVSLMLEHQIISEFFDYCIENGELPTKQEIENRMRELNVCGESLINRRASSVFSWLHWLFDLVNR